MTIQIEADARFSRQLAVAFEPRSWISIAILFAAAIVLRHVLAANTDVSCLLTIGEWILDGQRLYVDVLEVNPPMAVLVYIPGIVIARALGLPVEAVTDGLIFTAIFASLAIVARILKNSSVLPGITSWPLAPLGFAVLAILPMQTFGQREHIAIVELLPLLAVFAVRMKGETPSAWMVVIAGCGAGLAVSFKPHFVIGILCAVGCVAIYLRSWKPVFAPENLIAAVIALLYVASVIAFFPEFFTVMGPLIRDVYLPAGLSLPALLEKPALPVWGGVIFLTIVLKRHDRIDAACLLLLATSFGFAAVFLLQRKGWPYHSYPMLALGLLAFSRTLVSNTPLPALDRGFRAGGIILFAVLFARSMLWFDVAFDARPLQAAVARLGPNPKILAVSGEPGLGHPLVRALNGTWVSRQQSLWVGPYLAYMRQHGVIGPQADPVLDGYAARERTMMIEDFNRIRPTVVLVDNLTGNGSEWLRSHPDIAGLLSDYQLAETINRIDILKAR
jgi:hypothetical protein